MNCAIGPGPYRFYAPSLDLTIHFLEDTHSQWLMTHVHARRAREAHKAGAEQDRVGDERAAHYRHHVAVRALDDDTVAHVERLERAGGTDPPGIVLP